MSENPQSPNFIPRAPLDETAYRVECYQAGQTIAQVDDDIARMKALDAAQVAQQAASDRAYQERQAKTDAMMAEENARAALNAERMKATSYYWAPPEGSKSPFMAQPESIAQRNDRNAAKGSK